MQLCRQIHPLLPLGRSTLCRIWTVRRMPGVLQASQQSPRYLVNLCPHAADHCWGELWALMQLLMHSHQRKLASAALRAMRSQCVHVEQHVVRSVCDSSVSCNP